MKKNILYISYDGMTDPLGQSQVLPYIIGLSKHGYDFHLISFEKEERFKMNRALINEICLENGIQWHPLKYTKKPPVFSTIFDVYKLFKLTNELYENHNFEIIHCRSYISALVGLSYKKKKKSKFIFDMRGFWADERVDGNIWDLDNPIFKYVYNYFKKKECEFLIHSDAVISLTENGKEEMLNWKIKELSPSKINVIPCATDFDVFQVNTQSKKKRSKELLGLDPETFVVSYLGSLGTWYLTDEMLEFYKTIKTRYSKSKFLVLTGESPEIIYQRLDGNSLTKDDFIIKYAKRNEITDFMHASDLSLIFIKDSYSKKSSSPTKMGELLAMGIPIICNDIGDVKTIIDKLNVGVCISSFNLESYQNALEAFQTKIDKNPSFIRESSYEFFNLNSNVLKYLKVYNSIS